MKNSIGSLAALAAFAAPAFAAPLPPPVAADFSHVPVSLSDTTPIDFDIDGDGTDDFYVYGNFGNGLHIIAHGATTFSDGFSGGLTADSESFPNDISFSGNTVIFSDETVYLGFSFTAGSTGQAHAAWVLFDTNSAAPMVVGGGWQTIQGEHVVVGTPSAVPEPASFAALAGLGVLAGALATRRRRSAPPAVCV